MDRAELEQALENLVTKPITYTQRGGTIEVEVRQAGSDLSLVVRHDGVGMSPDEVAQACNAFWRAEAATNAAIQGFGIGLTLVRDVVAAHHGQMPITSRPGAGTIVTLSLPASG